ncbi:hypothetical protein Z949_1975 [Sulfitobacter guttiformis KCTC 32187]|nr:hypothetical protein Z949_1975 [Sulfitobacter guttiformis KCTC 32187]
MGRGAIRIKIILEELGQPVKQDVMRPLRAFDAGGGERKFDAMFKA